MPLQDGVNVKPAEKSGRRGLTALNWAQIRSEPADQRQFSGEGLEGAGERTWPPSSQLGAVSHLSETHHTHPSDVGGPSLHQQATGRGEGVGGRRAPAFQQLGPCGRVPTCSVKPPQCTQVCLCLKRSYFWYPLQGESLDNLYLTTVMEAGYRTEGFI